MHGLGEVREGTGRRYERTDSSSFSITLCLRDVGFYTNDQPPRLWPDVVSESVKKEMGGKASGRKVIEFLELYLSEPSFTLIRRR